MNLVTALRNGIALCTLFKKLVPTVILDKWYSQPGDMVTLKNSNIISFSEGCKRLGISDMNVIKYNRIDEYTNEDYLNFVMTFLRAVLNRSVVNDMTTQSLRELLSKYDKWRRKSLTKAPEPPAASMVSARLQGSPFGSSKRKNSRLVSEEDREHLRQILEKELEEKEQKAREPAEPAEHNPQPPVSTVSTISSPGFSDDLKNPAVSATPSTPPVSTVSTVSTIPGGGNPMRNVEVMETVESDASSVGSLPPLDSFLEDSAVKLEKPKISTVTTFSTIPNASNSMEEGQISSDEERNASLLEQLEKEMGISGIPKKDPISRSLELPDGMNEMGLYVDETPAPNPLERFQLMSCLVQLEETWKSEAAAKRPAPRYVQTSSYSRGSQPSNRRALSPALSSSRQPISRAPKEDSIRKGVSASKMPAAGKTAVSPRLGVSSKAVSPRLGVSSKAVSPKGTAGKTALRNSPTPNSYNGPNSFNGPNSYNGPNASSPLKASNPPAAASSAVAGPNASASTSASASASAAASKFSYFSSYGAASAASPALSASNPPKPALSASTNPMNPSNPSNPSNLMNSMNSMNPSNPSNPSNSMNPSIPSIPSGSLGSSLRSLDSGTLKKEPGGSQPRHPQFSPLQRAGKDPILSAVPGSPGSPGGRRSRLEVPMVMRYPMLRSLSTRTSIVEEVMPEPRYEGKSRIPVPRRTVDMGTFRSMLDM